MRLILSPDGCFNSPELRNGLLGEKFYYSVNREMNSPPRHYVVTVAPAHPRPFDEGMSLKVLLPASNRKHAMLRARRYVPGTITAVQVVRWTPTSPAKSEARGK